MSRVLFVSPTYVTNDTADAFLRHVRSIDMQKGNYRHIVVDDASPVSEIAMNVIDGGKTERREVVRVKENIGSPLASTMTAIKLYAKPDDIVAIVDGDDWLLTDNVCEVLDSVYSVGTEIAWSNFMCSDGTPGHCKWFPEIVHPRDQWYSSHLKTFRADLLDRIDDSLLRVDGDYAKYAGDCALYWSLLERSHRRMFIPLFLYCYNVTNPLSERRKDNEKANEIAKIVRERRQTVRGQPTKRGMVDTGRVCNESCKFCYYAKETCSKKFEKIEDLKKRVDTLKAGGREVVDLSGGEPSIHPDIVELVNYIHDAGLKVCMITNGQKGFRFSCDEYLVSLHGVDITHDKLVQLDGAYGKILKELPSADAGIRFNCVINKENKDELLEIAEVMADFNPKIVNFINFNPYYNWSTGSAEEIQAKYSDFNSGLSDAIEYLDKEGIGVNVRYLPFCQLKGKEKHVCGIMQHAFDDYEWLDTDMSCIDALQYVNGIRERNNNNQNNVCCACAMQQICDGPNKQYSDRFGLGELKPYVNGYPTFGPMDVIKFRFLYDEVWHGN